LFESYLAEDGRYYEWCQGIMRQLREQFPKPVNLGDYDEFYDVDYDHIEDGYDRFEEFIQNLEYGQEFYLDHGPVGTVVAIYRERKEVI
jgi:hypothetical protein